MRILKFLSNPKNPYSNQVGRVFSFLANARGYSQLIYVV